MEHVHSWRSDGGDGVGAAVAGDGGETIAAVRVRVHVRVHVTGSGVGVGVWELHATDGPRGRPTPEASLQKFSNPRIPPLIPPAHSAAN